MTNYNFNQLSYEEGLALIKQRKSASITKEALDFNKLYTQAIQLYKDNPELIHKIAAGMGIGGILGLLNTLTRREDTRRPMQQMLGGVLLGGIAGVGLHSLMDVDWTTAEAPSVPKTPDIGERTIGAVQTGADAVANTAQQGFEGFSNYVGEKTDAAVAATEKTLGTPFLTAAEMFLLNSGSSALRDPNSAPTGIQLIDKAREGVHNLTGVDVGHPRGGIPVAAGLMGYLRGASEQAKLRNIVASGGPTHTRAGSAGQAAARAASGSSQPASANTHAWTVKNTPTQQAAAAKMSRSAPFKKGIKWFGLAMAPYVGKDVLDIGRNLYEIAQQKNQQQP